VAVEGSTSHTLSVKRFRAVWTLIWGNELTILIEL